MDREQRSRLFFVGLLAVLPVVMLLSVGSGPITIPMADIIDILLHRLGLNSATPDIQQQLVVEAIRLPRTLIGVLVGSSLAACGAVMQGLFRNPLADPGIIGVSSGAALGAALGIVLGGTWLASFTELFQAYTVSVTAFIGGFLSTLLVYRIGTTGQGTSVATMLLAGIAVSALSGAGIGLMNYIADDTMLRSMTFWQMGNLANGNWSAIIVAASFLIPLQLIFITRARGLNALLLGESEARHLGLNVQKLKMQLIMLTAIGVGVSVSLAGMIGFVGLVVPHLVRLAIGPDHRWLIPCSSLLGAGILLLADIIARLVITPAELPIGIVTALLGAPFFITMLWQQRKRIL